MAKAAPKSELRTAVISIRVRPEVKAAIELLADEAHRPLANYIETMLIERIDEEMNSTRRARK